MNEKMNENLNVFVWEKPQLIVLGSESTKASSGPSSHDAYECAVS